MWTELRLAALLCLSLFIGACGGQEGMRCEDRSRYETADSILPVRVPDDLTPPDETESLRIPTGERRAAADDSELPCLESAPPFFEDDA